MKSQEINLTLNSTAQAATQKYLSSATSISIRLPAFDYYDNNGKAYLKVKSDDFIFAKSALVDTGKNSSVVIVPTDDPNLKMVIIPQECLT